MAQSGKMLGTARALAKACPGIVDYWQAHAAEKLAAAVQESTLAAAARSAGFSSPTRLEAYLKREAQPHANTTWDYLEENPKDVFPALAIMPEEGWPFVYFHYAALLSRVETGRAVGPRTAAVLQGFARHPRWSEQLVTALMHTSCQLKETREERDELRSDNASLRRERDNHRALVWGLRNSLETLGILGKEISCPRPDGEELTPTAGEDATLVLSERMRGVLAATRLDDPALSLSTRAINCFGREGITNLLEVYQLGSEEELIGIRNMGLKVLREIRSALSSLGAPPLIPLEER